MERPQKEIYTHNSSADYQLDVILKELGGFKKYQWIYCLLVSLPIVLMACHVTTFVFTVSVPTFRCVIPECEGENPEFNATWLSFTIPNKEDQPESCVRFAPVLYNLTELQENNDNTRCTPDFFDQNVMIPCKEIVYSDMNSIVGEFNIGCEQWKQTLIGTMNGIGALMGTFFAGVICDVYGRKSVLISGMFLSGLCGIVRILVPEYWTFAIFELLNGFVVAGVFVASVIMCVEIVEPKYRVLSTTFSCYTYAIGEIILGLVAWAFPYYKTILAILYLPSLLFILYIWFIPESLRWLLGEHRLTEISEIITKIAKVNNIKLCPETLQKFYDTVERNQSAINTEQTQGSQRIFSQIRKSKTLALRLICCSIWFFFSSFIYFGLTYNPAMLSGNMYLNFILVAIVEIPGYTVYYFAVEWCGRKKPMMISFILTGLTLIAFVFIPEGMIWLNIVFYLFGKFLITVAYTVLYIYSAELFPTFMRGSVMGICSLFGGIGTFMAPQIPLLSAYMESLPFLLFGGSAMVCGLTSMIFPETSNVKLPDTVEEAENIGKLPL